MPWLEILTVNPILLRSLLAWSIAQGLKVAVAWYKSGYFSWERLYGAGGMPSSHSAIVCSLVASVIRVEGFASTYTAVALIFAFIVMYDATGVRQAAGKHAEALNKIIIQSRLNGHVSEIPLKELLGHTPLEVLAGAILGLIVGGWL